MVGVLPIPGAHWATAKWNRPAFSALKFALCEHQGRWVGVSGADCIEDTTMHDSTFVEQQLDTIHRQAKRFAVKLKLPITVAKDVLAKAFYRCAKWSDLEERLKSRTLSRHIQLLTALPRSDEARLYLSGIDGDLAKSLSQHMLTNSNLAGLIDHVREVFAVASAPTTLDDLVPNLRALPWRPAGIGPDSWAVVESEVVVNGVWLRLVGTRTYLPRYYNFGPKHESGKFAEPLKGKLRIIWTEPMVWYQAALDYLDDPEAEDVQLPVAVLTEEMARHQAWFEAALVTTGSIAEYRDGDDDLLQAILVKENLYIVFGYPVRSTSEAEQASFVTVELASTCDNFSQVVMLNQNPICLEWIAYDTKTARHPGQFDEYFVMLKQAILRNECLPATPRKDGQPGLLFVRPATDFDIHQALKVDFTYLADEVAFVFKTSNLSLCRKLLCKVAARDLMTYFPTEHPRYFALILVPRSDLSPELSLTFDAEIPGGMSVSDLVHTVYSKEQEDRWELLVEIDPQIMNLVDRIGRKAMDTAISHGSVQRLSIKFLDELKQPPARCRQIPQMADEIANALDRPPLTGDGYFTMRRVRYWRDNF